MYLPENYRAQIYHDLFKMTNQIMNIVLGIDDSPYEIKRAIMLKLGVEKVRRGNTEWICLTGKNCRRREIERAFRDFVEEVPKYLSEYFERYKHDFIDGVFQEVRQTEFQFEEGFTTRDARSEKPTREENTARFFSEIAAKEESPNKKHKTRNRARRFR